MKWKRIFSSDLFTYIPECLSAKWILVFCMNLIMISVFGQITIEGVVRSSDGESLIGVNVQVKGTTKGTATDFDGKYVLEDIDENAVWSFHISVIRHKRFWWMASLS